MKYYVVRNDIELISRKKVSNGFTTGYKLIELIENELITEKELKRLQIDQYKDNTNVFKIIVTSSHNTHFFFGASFLDKEYRFLTEH